MNSDAHSLEARIEALEQQLTALTDYCHDLEWRILKLAIAKRPEVAYPYWNWLLSRGISDNARRTLMHVLSALNDRAAGEETSLAFQKDIEGVPRNLLYATEPLQPREVFDAIKHATGMKDDTQVQELLEAVQGQGMFLTLCALISSNDPK